MNCDKYLDLISARLDGELTAWEEAALAAHLQSCPACRAIAEDLRGLHSALADVGEVAAPAALSQNVMARIKEEKQRSRRRFVRQLSGLAASLVLCVGVWHLTRPQLPAAADSDQPSLARHAESQPFDLRGSEHYAFSNEQRLRLSDMSTSLESAASLLDGADGLSRFLARFTADDLSTVTNAYDEEFFHTRRLLAVVVQEPSSSTTHAIISVDRDKVTLVRRTPQAGDCDMALWLILAEVDRAGSEQALDVEFINQ